MVVCDTHVLLYDAMEPAKLSRTARDLLEEATRNGELACSGISLWEVAMLIHKRRIPVAGETLRFLNQLMELRQVTALPITPEIAALAYSSAFSHGDPADRIIAATAMAHGALLITEDRLLHEVQGLTAVW
jgi:PIN domain nuclease of toxin-antitoxin system